MLAEDRTLAVTSPQGSEVAPIIAVRVWAPIDGFDRQGHPLSVLMMFQKVCGLAHLVPPDALRRQRALNV
jgi:hypothetical protein